MSNIVNFIALKNQDKEINADYILQAFEDSDLVSYKASEKQDLLKKISDNIVTFNKKKFITAAFINNNLLNELKAKDQLTINEELRIRAIFENLLVKESTGTRNLEANLMSIALNGIALSEKRYKNMLDHALLKPNEHKLHHDKSPLFYILLLNAMIVISIAQIQLPVHMMLIWIHHNSRKENFYDASILQKIYNNNKEEIEKFIESNNCILSLDDLNLDNLDDLNDEDKRVLKESNIAEVVFPLCYIIKQDNIYVESIKNEKITKWLQDSGIIENINNIKSLKGSNDDAELLQTILNNNLNKNSFSQDAIKEISQFLELSVTLLFSDILGVSNEISENSRRAAIKDRNSGALNPTPN